MKLSKLLFRFDEIQPAKDVSSVRVGGNPNPSNVTLYVGHDGTNPLCNLFRIYPHSHTTVGLGGAIDHADLANVLPDQHHAKLHALSDALHHSGSLGLGQHGALPDGDHVNGISGPAKMEIQDEGVLVAIRRALNFIGAGVTATDDALNDRVNISIPGGGGGAVESHIALIALATEVTV